MKNNIDETKFIKERGEICKNRDFIPLDLYKKYDVKRGLRDSNGKGVLTGLTNISRVDGFDNIDGVRVPIEGRLWFRGIDIVKLIEGANYHIGGFEEAAYLRDKIRELQVVK